MRNRGGESKRHGFFVPYEGNFWHMKKGMLIVCLLGMVSWVSAQRFLLPKGVEQEKIRFELVNNLIIIPMDVNGSELSFILDSGVSSPILFNLTDEDSIQINDVSTISLKGLGDGPPIEALKSENNQFAIGKARSMNQNMFVVLDRELNLSASLGRPVHGIIGWEVFRSFTVEVNYSKKYIRFHKQGTLKTDKLRKMQEIPLILQKKKAFVEGVVTLEDNTEREVKLLVDTGSSDAIWLFRDLEQGLDVPEKNFEEFLGKGLSGEIHGLRTKIKAFRIGNYQLIETKAAFPFRDSFANIINLEDRNGSVGGEVLKRFNLVVDYKNSRLYLKKNGYYKDPFQYNLAGIDIQHNGVRLIRERIADVHGRVKTDDRTAIGSVKILLEPRTRISLVPEIVVSGIRAGSPADEAGLQQGDIILAVNGKKVHEYKLQEIIQMLNEREGKRVKVRIERYNRELSFSFLLKDVFKEKP